MVQPALEVFFGIIVLQFFTGLANLAAWTDFRQSFISRPASLDWRFFHPNSVTG